MQASDWIALFKKMPDEYQELMMLVTNTGVELAVQQFLRLDDTQLLLRGRLGGTTDANRIFLVPYDYLSFVYFVRPISNAKLTAVFGELIEHVVAPKDYEAEAVEEQPTPQIDIADLPQIDVASLQPQARPAAAPAAPATAPRSVAASLRERLLRARGGPRP